MEVKGWIYRSELDDWACDGCGTSHAFLPTTSDADISTFLAGHEHGDFRLPPDFPQDQADLTRAQRKDSADPVWGRQGQVGPREEMVVARIETK